jgi:MOSC domain-containing protein YiiM
VNVGGPREVDWHGRAVRTSIWKAPVEGPVRVTTLNLEGDEQSDLSVHGGSEKAVYVYPSEHYEYWRRELPTADLPWGALGENFTTEGLLETEVSIGDRLRSGSAEFLVTQPRVPCYKLGIRFGRDDMVKRFLRSGRSGFYLAVVREGEVAAGGRVELAGRDHHGVTVADIAALYARDADSEALLRRAVELPALPEGWKEHLRRRLRE